MDKEENLGQDIRDFKVAGTASLETFIKNLDPVKLHAAILKKLSEGDLTNNQYQFLGEAGEESEVNMVGERNNENINCKGWMDSCS